MAYAGAQFVADGLDIGVDVVQDFLGTFRREDAEVAAPFAAGGLFCFVGLFP